MMFARTQMGVDRLVEQLAAVGVRAGALHGGKTQRVRTRTLAEFKEGRTNVLVATDVAARGIHVDGVSLVVHVDPPKDPKDYLHRAGRTARAGESGAVATLVLPKQRRTTLAMLEKAGVEPAQTRVRPGDAALAEVTGAQQPSGVPVVNEPEPPRRGERRYDDRPRGDRRYDDRPRGERRFGSPTPQGERRFGSPTPQGERRFGSPTPQGERRYDDRPQGERRFGSPTPQGERRYDDRPQGERRFGSPTPQGERSGERHGGFRHDGRSGTDRPRDDRHGGGERRFDGRRPSRTH